MSAAYKYAAFQTFAIPTEGTPDADAETHEVVRGMAPTILQDWLIYIEDSESSAVLRARMAEAIKAAEEVGDKAASEAMQVTGDNKLAKAKSKTKESAT